MKAWVLKDLGRIVLEDRERPSAGEHEVLVKVSAAGVCGSDIPRIYRTGAYHYPLIPGHEFSGVVEELGSGAEKDWLHKRVGIFPLIPCRECAPCRKKQYEMCRNYSYLGSRRDGGFAEYAAVPVENLLLLPNEVSEEAAAMLEPMAVAVHAVRRVSLSTEDSVVVCGLGTIGLLVLMFLLEMGLRNIFVVGNKEFQRRMAEELGIPGSHYCDKNRQDAGEWILAQTKGLGADVFFECVGKNETVVQAVNAARPGGRIVLVGNPYSDMLLGKAVYWKVLRNQLTVTGTWNSSFTHSMEDDWHYALERVRRGTVVPQQLITHRLAMDELEKGLLIMRDKKEDYGKIMVNMCPAQ